MLIKVAFAIGIMNDSETILFGIPVPSTNKVFLTLIVLHIILGLACVLSGIIAILSTKTSHRHKLAGKVYYWAYGALFFTILVTSIMRWPHSIHLLTIGFSGYFLTLMGRRLAQSKPKNWTRIHTACMGLSYIFLLAGFYVDNGKNLPFWRQFSSWQLFIFPFVIGVPIIINAFFRHPLNKRSTSRD